MSNWSVVGHEWAVRQLQASVKQETLPHALLITGVQGIGKTTLARAAISALFCTNEDGERPCGECTACRKLKSVNFPDFLPVEPDAKGGKLKIESIRDVERFLTFTPLESQLKLVLISGFERATLGAANALLKTLEEPPSYAHLILLASDADLLLPTIVSRSQQLNLRPIPRQDIEQALIERWGVKQAEATKLARLAGGRMGWAVRAATEPEYQKAMVDAVDALFELAGMTLPERFQYAAELVKQNTDLNAHFEYWLTCWRDVLLLQTGNAGDIVFAHQENRLLRIAEQVSVSVTAGMIKRLEEAQQALLGNVNKTLLVENMMIHLPELTLD